MIVTFASIRGAPGVTSWSLLTALAWPAAAGRSCVVVEADPGGGVLGVRYGFGVDPGVVSLIAAVRRPEAIDVTSHGRTLQGGVCVVPGPETGEQSTAVWQPSADAVGARLASDERLWLVDAGRLWAASPVTALAQRSQLVVLLCGPATEDLVQVPARVAALQAGGVRVGVAVVGRVAHSTCELAEFFGTDAVWSLPAERDLVAVTGSVAAGEVRSRRSWAWRAAVGFAAELHDQATAPPPQGATASDVVAKVVG